MAYTVKILPPALKFLESLPLKLEAKAYRAILLLKTFGYSLREPHSKTLINSGGIKELRIKVGTDICRFFYFHFKDTIYVITSGYVKKEMKTDKNEIEKAQKLRKQFIEEEKL
jgi:phage-related protein